MRNDILVFIPTYNERGNVEKLYKEIKKLPYPIDILFCDDNSPDGTGKTIDVLALTDQSVKVMHRPKKLGLGTAQKEAFIYAAQNNYRWLIIMDADFTHDPKYIPGLLAQKENADIVIGSRYASGGSMEGWSKFRLPFTYFWRGMIKLGLGMPYDCTGAFRLYNVAILKEPVFKQATSRGFSYGMEALYYFKLNGARITEIPITARSREYGESKLSGAIMREVVRTYFNLVKHRITRCAR